MALTTSSGRSATSVDSLMSTTLDKYYKSGKMHDAVFKSNPTFATLQEGGRIEYATGGYQIVVNLMYGKNSTVGSYTKYEVIDVSPQDGMGQAYYPWATYSGALSIDGLSEFQNSGEGKLISHMGEKLEQLTGSFSEKMNQDLWEVDDLTAFTTGNGGKDIVPIPFYIHRSASTSAALGGINGNTYTWWRPTVKDGSSLTTGSGVLDYMRNVYNSCSKGGGGSPDVIMMDQLSFELYEKILDTKVRYTQVQKGAAGFETIGFRGANVFWDEHVPDSYGSGSAFYDWDNASWAKGSIYFVNSKFMKLVVAKGKDFRPRGFQTPDDQDARVNPYFWYGQFVCSNRRKHGVLHGLTFASITASS